MGKRIFEIEISGIGAAIVLGLFILGAFIKSGMGRLADKDRYVTVKGLAEKEVMADRVVWPLPFEYVSNDITTLYDEFEKQKSEIIAFLKEAGFTDSEINVSAPSLTDREAQTYQPENIKYRYQVSAVITVISTKVNTAINLMSRQGELMKKGIIITDNYQYRTSFEFTKLNDVKPQMIEEATRNARTVAQKFAEDSESELGGIRQANQGQFSITSDENAPQKKNIRVVTTVDYFLE